MSSNSMAALRRELGLPGAILSPPEANPKVAKNGKLGVMGWVLHLSPAKESGYEMCPGRSAGCTLACLHFSGNPLYHEAKNASRKRKTIAFVKQRDAFMNLLALEISKALDVAKLANMEPAFRLNGTSDILFDMKKFTLFPWVAEKIGRGVGGDKVDIIRLFGDIQFYDYSAVLRPIDAEIPSNYHITFSEKEDNQANVAEAMRRGFNIASVFPKKKVPATHLGRTVIDGDEHDYRPADPKGVIVGLKVKGSLGLADTTGFVLT